MDFNTVRSSIIENQYLRSLSHTTQGLLLRDANLRTAPKGHAIYEEGAEMDDTFCLLLEGELSVVQGGIEIAKIEAWELFGEVAFFTKAHARSAAVVVVSEDAVWVKWKIARADLDSEGFADLRKALEEKTGATL